MPQKKNRPELLRHSLARRSPKHGEVIDLVFHGKSVTKVAQIAGIAEAGVRRHGGRAGRPYRAGRSMAEPPGRD